VINISSAKFEKHFIDISRDIVYSLRGLNKGQKKEI